MSMTRTNAYPRCAETVSAADRSCDAATHLGGVLGLAPRPRTLEDTGLSLNLASDLVCKHLYEGGVLDLHSLSHRLALPGLILEEVLSFLRAEGRVEVRGRSGDSVLLRYALTDKGRSSAADALLRDGYVGPAPVSLEAYTRIVAAQSVRRSVVTRAQVQDAFADTVIDPSLLDQLGPAVHSGRAIFIYGDPGTGKSFITRRLARLLGGPVLLPRALLVQDSIIQYLDPGVHHPVSDTQASSSLDFAQGYDPRYLLCERPVVLTGGELTLDLLELQYESKSRRYLTPLQLRANTGLLIIDDLGRQRVTPVDLFNRWIVPLEEGRDFLTLRGGHHFAVPFDAVLVFSTNLNPLDLADEAFLRRIGYKIRFDPVSREQYAAIWAQNCEQRGLDPSKAVLDYVVDELHRSRGVPLLPCHPRDLIDLALDYLRYTGQDRMNTRAMDWAWKNYFINLAWTQEGSRNER
jgi:hypothetical protein